MIRAVGLLKAFSKERPERTLVELSDGLGLSKTTAHRLLTALESEGLVARNPVTRTYRLDEINQGYADLEAGKNLRGVVVLDQ